jgi:hypothetical protein
MATAGQEKQIRYQDDCLSEEEYHVTEDKLYVDMHDSGCLHVVSTAGGL